MDELLTLQGDVRDLPVPEILRNLLKNEGSASLAIHHDDLVYHFWAVDHKIVCGDTNDKDSTLASILFAHGLFGLDEMEMIEKEERPLAEILDPDQLVEGLEQQIVAMLRIICRLRHGKYTLTFEEEPPKDAIRVSLDTYRAVMNAIREIPFWSVIEQSLGGMRKVYRQTPGKESMFFSFSLQEEESHLYNYLENPMSLKDLVNVSYLSPFETARIILALKTVDLVEEVAPGTEKPIQRKTEEILYRLSSLVENYNEAFAKLYALLLRLAPEEAHDFIINLVLELEQPYRDLLTDMNLENEGRVDFDQLYHNAVQLGVSNLQQTITDLLNEYLYAWVLHLHQRFGREYQDEINKAISVIRE